MKTIDKKALEVYLHKNIPISKFLGVTVNYVSSHKVVLSAPLENNINHKKTVFGGSLQAVATLACWSIVHINLDEFPEHEIVITASEIFYRKPVTENFKVSCSLCDSTWKRFYEILHRKGKAKIKLNAQIDQNEETAVVYQGAFAAVKAI